MNTLLNLPPNLTRVRGLSLILTANKARAGITELIAALILRGPLFIVAASEWLPASALPRLVRRASVKVTEITNHLRTVRAATCYRLLDSLSNTPSNGEPILILDFLHTFYDSDMPLGVRFYRLGQCCRHLKRLAFYRPVIVMTQEMPTEEYEKFYSILHSIADKTFYLEPEPERVSQLPLF